MQLFLRLDRSELNVIINALTGHRIDVEKQLAKDLSFEIKKLIEKELIIIDQILKEIR